MTGRTWSDVAGSVSTLGVAENLQKLEIHKRIPAHLLLCACSSHTCEKIAVVTSYSFADHLLWQPEETNTTC